MKYLVNHRHYFRHLTKNVLKKPINIEMMKREVKNVSSYLGFRTHSLRLSIHHQLLFSWVCYNCVWFDFKNHTGDTPQVRQRLLSYGRQELKVSQQIGRKKKQLHFGYCLSQTQSGPSSKRNQGTKGPATTFQKAFCNKSDSLSQLMSTALCTM